MFLIKKILIVASLSFLLLLTSSINNSMDEKKTFLKTWIKKQKWWQKKGMRHVQIEREREKVKFKI